MKFIQDRNLIEEITYDGECDILRNDHFQWREFKEDELTVGNVYEIVDSCLMQWIYVKKDNEIVRDVSGKRYLYWAVENESGKKIYVWERFFKENTNL